MEDKRQSFYPAHTIKIFINSSTLAHLNVVLVSEEQSAADIPVSAGTCPAFVLVRADTPIQLGRHPPIRAELWCHVTRSPPIRSCAGDAPIQLGPRHHGHLTTDRCR